MLHNVEVAVIVYLEVDCGCRCLWDSSEVSEKGISIMIHDS